MDSDPPPPTRRKVKFAPKSQGRRKAKAAAVQPKKEEADEAAEAQKLLQHLSELEALRRQRFKVESKSSVQAAFIHGSRQSIASRVSNVPQDASNTESNQLELKHETEVPSSSMVGLSAMKEDSSPEHEYIEPWDYAHTYYPNEVPWRRPYSGDPDIFYETEFGEAARKLEYDEGKINPASELGVLDTNETSENPRLLFFQLPQSLPVIKRSATAKGKEKEGTFGQPDQRGLVTSAMGKGTSIRVGNSQRSCRLEELSAGHMGKLVVYKSGAVKLKLGDNLYEVSPGSECTFAQEVVAINAKEKECCRIGELHKQAVVTPDIEYLLNRVIDIG